MPQIPSKEILFKILSTTATGAGAITSSVGALTGSHSLTNLGAVANLAGNALDDVPEKWLQERARNTYIQMLQLVEPCVRHALLTDAGRLARFRTDDPTDNEYATRCARLIQFFANNALPYELAQVENIPAVLKAVCAGVAFGLSVRDATVGALGAFGVGAGLLVGHLVARRTLSARSHAAAPKPTCDPQTPAPQPEATTGAVTEKPLVPENIMDYADVYNMPVIPQHNDGSAGDYKGRIAIMKFCGGVTTGLICSLGLFGAHKRAPATWHNYVDNDFFSALTNAVAAGAAFGALFATIGYRVGSAVQRRRQMASMLFFEQQRQEPQPELTQHEGPGPGYQRFERIFMGAIFW